MRILIYSLNYSPELIGVGKYSGEMAQWLASRGHEVRVIAAPPYYPDWRIPDPFSGARYSLEEENGIQVTRCPIWIPARVSGIKRVLHLLTFAISSFPRALAQAFWRPDIVWVVEPTLCVFPTALLVARVSGAKAWAHVQDLEVDAAFDLGMLPRAPRRFALSIERWLLRRFDRVSTISPNMRARICDKGIPQSGVGLFPNWIDTQSIFPLQRASTYRAQLGIAEDKVVALYAGNMAAKQGFDVLIEAVKRLAGRCEIEFVFCGQGPSRAILAETFATAANVHMLPLQPLDRLNELLNLADVHLLPQRADAADLVMPAKLLGMFASGRPVLATAKQGTQLAQAVEGCGIVIPPDDPSALATAIERLSRDRTSMNELGKNARHYAVTRMDSASILPQFERELEGLVAVQSCSASTAI